MSPLIPHSSYLLAFDGSEHSLAAVELLCDICPSHAVTRNIKVHLLTIFTPRQIKDHDLLSNNLVNIKQYLEEKQCFEVSTDLILGYPTEKILEFADQIMPDMILMGAKGLRATLGILLGGVAQQVVEYSCCPVMVARAPYRKLDNVLIVVDSSPYSQQAINYLEKLKLPNSIKLTVLHVMPPPPAEILPTSATEIWPLIADQIPLPSIRPDQTIADDALLKEEEQHGNELLASVVTELRSAGRDAERLLLRGDAATEILKFSRDSGVKLIIAGSRGLSQLRGLFIGSVSRKLVHYSDCSVLIVKSPLSSNQES